jgi:glucokinase
MPILAIDLGGTKLAAAVFTEDGGLIAEETIAIEKRQGHAVGELITEQVEKYGMLQKKNGQPITSVGVSVPGIYHKTTGTVWAPNIPGWENYPLLEEIKSVAANMPVSIDSDRSCYILGECWKGAARNCSDAIYLAVGTGIGAGILADGKLLRGTNEIAGAVGWMALKNPYKKDYNDCGCFETMASGEGIIKLAKKILLEKNDYSGKLKAIDNLSAIDVFNAYEEGDKIAKEILDHCIELWGMAIANLVSIFNPQKIILGGGVFGPAIKFIPAIREEAFKWAQPVSIKQVVIEASALGRHAVLYGAAFIYLQSIKTNNDL